MSGRLPPDRPGRLPDPSDDDDDGIPLEGFEDRPKRRPRPAKPLHKPTNDNAQESPRCGPCWVCQCSTFSDQCPKVAGRILPVCIKCWDAIPPAERVRIGLQLIATDDARPLQEVAAMVLARIKGDVERAVDKGDDPFGIFGSGN